MSAKEARNFCLTSFPRGIYPENIWGISIKVGIGPGELLPGLYEYRRMDGGDKRVEASNCDLILNYDPYGSSFSRVELPYGESFTFRFFTYHEDVFFFTSCRGRFYRIGD